VFLCEVDFLDDYFGGVISYETTGYAGMEWLYIISSWWSSRHEEIQDWTLDESSIDAVEIESNRIPSGIITRYISSHSIA